MTSTLLNLPLHPTMRHPLTGQPLRAIHVDKNGRARWPIMGGAPDGEGGDGADGGSGGEGGADGGAGDSGDKGAGDGSDGGGSDKGGKGGDGDNGFPLNTPRAQMTPEQQLAYDAHHGRKHEQRAREYREAAGGLTAEQVAEALADYNKIKRESMTDQERAVEDARRETRETATRETGTKAARAVLEIALGHDPEKGEEHDHSDLIDTLDVSKILTDSGEIDTAKVRALVAKIAPADKDKGTRHHDYGGGHRGGSKPSSGLAAGAERYAQRRGKTAASSTT